MFNLNKKSAGIIFLFSRLGLHIAKLQARMEVPSPSLRPVQHGKLDCLGRAEVETGAAEFAPVLPDRVTLFDHDIFYRADCRTGAA